MIGGRKASAYPCHSPLLRNLTPTATMRLSRLLRSHDPLHILPYELWLECIKIYARDQPEGPLPLFDISAIWRGRLLESPQIWTTIYYDGGHDEGCRAETFFQLSRDLPVEVIVGRTPGTMAGMMKYSNRVQSILFWTRSTSSVSDFGTSFLSELLNGNWYSKIIRLYNPPARSGETLLLSSAINALPTLVGLFEQWVDIDHPEAITATANLAVAYYFYGPCEKAETVASNAVNIRVNSFEAHHPNTIIAMSNLAMIHVNRRNLDATQLLLRSLANIAAGCATGSEELYVEILEQSRSALGGGHPDTISTMKDLASLYTKQDRYIDATPLKEEILQYYRRVSGVEHLNSTKAANELASIYLVQGRLSEAEALLEDVLEQFEKTIGQDHPDAITAGSNLAVTYYEQGRRDEAAEVEMEVLEWRKRTLGQDHPDTIIATSNLAAMFHEQGRWDDAAKLKVEVLRYQRRTLGPNHPDTITVALNLAATYRKQGRWDEAAKIEMEGLKRRRQILD